MTRTLEFIADHLPKVLDPVKQRLTQIVLRVRPRLMPGRSTALWPNHSKD